MKSLLLLVHRFPYPPNKGDKVRSLHLLRRLAATHRVFLGTFVDDPADFRHVGVVEALCAGLHIERLAPVTARLRSVVGFATGEALTLPYYRNARLQAWVDRTIDAERIDTAVVFSTPMAQYVDGRTGLRTLVDLVDVDSAKWAEFAQSRPWPLSWVYARESRRLLAYESAVVARADASFLVSDQEVDLFGKLAPGQAGRTEVIGQGVDAEYFSPDEHSTSPFPPQELAVVFTGAMNYWPNVDAACWFASDVLPSLRERFPTVRFYVVGMHPARAVLALAGDDVVVTGTVPDVRPYLRHAAVVVAPLRIARGVQTKVLEAMATRKAVVVSEACVKAISARPGIELESAAGAADFVERVGALLADPARARAMGEAARQRVIARYSWQAQLAPLDRHLAHTTERTLVPA